MEGLTVKEFNKKHEQVLVLGSGGFGMVSLFRDKATNKLVAVKQFKSIPSPHERQVALNEIRLLLKVSASACHQNVACLLTFVYVNQAPQWAVMELVPGVESFDWVINAIGNNTPATPDQVLQFLLGCLRGIRFLHKRGVTHRDIKLENIMLTTDALRNSPLLSIRTFYNDLSTEEQIEVMGDEFMPVLIDVGLGCAVGAEFNCFSFAGTPGYVSPGMFKTFIAGGGVKIDPTNTRRLRKLIKMYKKNDLWQLGVAAYLFASLDLTLPSFAIQKKNHIMVWDSTVDMPRAYAKAPKHVRDNLGAEYGEMREVIADLLDFDHLKTSRTYLRRLEAAYGTEAHSTARADGTADVSSDSSASSNDSYAGSSESESSESAYFF